MKIIAYTPLHYGAEYLRWAIRSVIDQVDEYHVLYTPQGSHGTRTETPCPETRHQLYREALAGAGRKLCWHDGLWDFEGQQRDSIFSLVPDANYVIALDADEVWRPQAIERALQASAAHPEVRGWRLPMVHFWRSFQRAIVHDPAFPIRFINTHIAEYTENTVQTGAPIAHFGYAISEEIARYKRSVHGHHSEFRTDCDWYTDRFLANAQRDCHPVGSEYWNPEWVNPYDYMPKWMDQHPYWGMDVIR